MYKDDYKARYRAKFPTTTKPTVYDKDIPNNATNVVRAKAEAVHTYKLRVTNSSPPPNVRPDILYSR